MMYRLTRVNYISGRSAATGVSKRERKRKKENTETLVFTTGYLKNGVDNHKGIHEGARPREARTDGSELGHVESKLYWNGELHLHEERRCTGRGNPTRCTGKGSCIGKKNCTGKTCMGRSCTRRASYMR
jgi:hypothetical protein